MCVLNSLSNTVRIRSSDVGWGDCNNANAVLPISGCISCNAVTTYVQNTTGSLSLVSKETQLTGHPHCCAHVLTSVVLPNPAGAATSVRACCIPVCICANRRCRGTRSERIAGRVIFERKKKCVVPDVMNKVYPKAGLTPSHDDRKGHHYYTRTGTSLRSSWQRDI